MPQEEPSALPQQEPSVSPQQPGGLRTEALDVPDEMTLELGAPGTPTLQMEGEETYVPPGGTHVPPGGTVAPPGGTVAPPGGTFVPQDGTYVPPPGGRTCPRSRCRGPRRRRGVRRSRSSGRHGRSHAGRCWAVPAEDCRSAHRDGDDPATPDAYLGFRPAFTPPD